MNSCSLWNKKSSRSNSNRSSGWFNWTAIIAHDSEGDFSKSIAAMCLAKPYKPKWWSDRYNFRTMNASCVSWSAAMWTLSKTQSCCHAQLDLRRDNQRQIMRCKFKRGQHKDMEIKRRETHITNLVTYTQQKPIREKGQQMLRLCFGWCLKCLAFNKHNEFCFRFLDQNCVSA